MTFFVIFPKKKLTKITTLFCNKIPLVHFHIFAVSRNNQKADKGKNTPVGTKIAIRIKILTTKDYLSAFTMSALSAHLARLAIPFLQVSFVA